MIKRLLDWLCWWRKHSSVSRKPSSVLALIQREIELNPNRRITVDMDELEGSRDQPTAHALGAHPSKRRTGA